MVGEGGAAGHVFYDVLYVAGKPNDLEVTESLNGDMLDVGLERRVHRRKLGKTAELREGGKDAGCCWLQT